MHSAMAVNNPTVIISNNDQNITKCGSRQNNSHPHPDITKSTSEVIKTIEELRPDVLG